MHARRMPFMTPALFLVFAFSAASVAENAAPLPAPLPAPGSPSKPPAKSNSSDDDRDLRYLRFLNKGSQLKELAELLTRAGTNCPSPALDAEGVGPVAATVWYVDCKDGWHIDINYGGNTLVMDGKVDFQDLTR